MAASTCSYRPLDRFQLVFSISPLALLALARLSPGERHMMWLMLV